MTTQTEGGKNGGKVSEQKSRPLTAVEEAAQRAKAIMARKLSPDIQAAEDVPVGEVEAMERYYKEIGVIPKGCYGYTDLNTPDRVRQRVNAGYVPVIDPDTGEHVTVKGADALYYRDERLRKRAFQKASEEDARRLNAIDEALVDKNEAGTGITVSQDRPDVSKVSASDLEREE